MDGDGPGAPPSSATSPVLAELAAQHPWSKEILALAAPLDRSWHHDVEATPDELWPILIDTSRTNRALGLGEMQFQEVDGRLEGSAANLGVPQKWVEVPWEWVQGRGMVGIRLYSQGFAHAVRAFYALERTGEGTSRFFVHFSWIPRNLVWRVFLALGASWLRSRYTEVLNGVANDLKLRHGLKSLHAAPPALLPEPKSRLDALVGKLSARASGSVARRLADLIQHGDDMDLFRMRPRVLARTLGEPERDVIHAFLVGTREGLFNLTWDLICPHCRGVRQSPTSLADVPQRASCDVCQLEFGVDEENAVEVSFHVHPSVRNVPPVFYCAAEPAKKRHIVMQQRLPPGASRTVATLLEPGRWRARVIGKPDSIRTLDISNDAPPASGANPDPDSAAVPWRASMKSTDAIRAPRHPALAMQNDSGEEAMFVVEDARWADDALRPEEVFALQAFRDLFSRESLAAGVKLAVGEQTILFTDMVGSTCFYENKGDAEAFLEVRRHFMEVFAAVREEGGVVVKTIGDAVMAAYASPADALRSAARIQRLFPQERKDTPVRLRISLHKGPCLAVNLDTGIDYFGRTVNVAAKLQALADAHEIAFTRAFLDEPGVRDVVGGAALRDDVLEHPAFPEAIKALRYRP